MSKQVKVGLLLSLLVIVGVVVWQMLPPSEPVYQGKRLRLWLRDLDYTWTPAASSARNAIQHMGTNSVPTLIYYIRYQDPPWKRLYAWVVEHVLRRGRVDFEYQWHRRAALACTELGLKAQAAIPALVEASNNAEDEPEAFKALTAMLPLSAPALTNLLATGGRNARASAAVALRKSLWYPSLQVMAINALTNAMTDADWEIRVAAAYSLTDPPIQSHEDLRRSSETYLKQIDYEAAVKAGVK